MIVIIVCANAEHLRSEVLANLLEPNGKNSLDHWTKKHWKAINVLVHLEHTANRR